MNNVSAKSLVNYFWRKIPILSEKTEKNNVNRVKIYVKNVGGGLTLKCV